MASQRPELSLLALSHRHTDHCSPPTDPSPDSDSDDTSTSTTSSLPSLPSHPETSFYKSAQWTRDGTTIITSSYDLQVSTFLVPDNLLEPRSHPLTLRPHKTLRLAEPTNVVATAPYYDLRSANTDHLLVACRDHPLQLYSALSPSPNDSNNIPPEGENPENDNDDTFAHATTKSPPPDFPISSYRLVSPTTEAYLPIHSLVWSFPGTHFYTGTRDLIAEFDITRNGAGPTTQIPTIPSRRHIRKGNGVGMRGTISALSAQTMSAADEGFGTPTGLLAAGTWTRCVGLYDVHRSGECTATWSIKPAAEGVTLTEPPPPAGAEAPMNATMETTSQRGIGGAGILQTVWSPCGRYLLLNERQSTGMLVYDVRVTNKLLSVLAGRDATTHQRLTCDVFRGLDNVGGFEVWAGTRDGTVQVWEGIGNAEGCQWPSWDFSATDGRSSSSSLRRSGSRLAAAPAVGSVALHHSGSVVATASGCWEMNDELGDAGWSSDPGLDTSEDEDIESLAVNNRRSSKNARTQQSTLKLWSIGPPPTTNVPGDEVESMAIDDEVNETHTEDERSGAENPYPSAECYMAHLASDHKSGYDTADEVEQQIVREQASRLVELLHNVN